MLPLGRKLTGYLFAWEHRDLGWFMVGFGEPFFISLLCIIVSKMWKRRYCFEQPWHHYERPFASTAQLWVSKVAKEPAAPRAQRAGPHLSDCPLPLSLRVWLPASPRPLVPSLGTFLWVTSLCGLLVCKTELPVVSSRRSLKTDRSLWWPGFCKQPSCLLPEISFTHVYALMLYPCLDYPACFIFDIFVLISFLCFLKYSYFFISPPELYLPRIDNKLYLARFFSPWIHSSFLS